ncbi:MAG: helix-turn-helix domain-containing protein [Hymenobacter sp.]
MHITTFPPSPALADFVEYFGLCEDGASEEPSPAPSLAGGSTDAVLLLNESVHIMQPAEMVGVVIRRQRYLRQEGYGAVVGIYFRPTGYFHLFGVPSSEAPHAGPESEGDAGQFARELEQRVAETDTTAERLAAAEALLLARHPHPHPAPDAIDAVATTIRQQHGQVNIDELALDAGMSRRQLERRFQTEVGTPPKFYARIARFNHVFTLVGETPVPDWQDVAFLCGYYDQAHFIREFRSFTGETPTSYFQRHHEFTRFFLAR